MERRLDRLESKFDRLLSVILVGGITLLSGIVLVAVRQFLGGG